MIGSLVLSNIALRWAQWLARYRDSRRDDYVPERLVEQLGALCSTGRIRMQWDHDRMLHAATHEHWKDITL